MLDRHLSLGYYGPRLNCLVREADFAAHPLPCLVVTIVVPNIIIKCVSVEAEADTTTTVPVSDSSDPPLIAP